MGAASGNAGARSRLRGGTIYGSYGVAPCLVTAVDLSDAIDAAKETAGRSVNVRFAQADLSQLPFAPGQFDLVISLGVLQHTPDPESAIAKLWQQVKPQGALVIDHYSFQKWSYYTTALPYVRAVIGSMKRESAMRWTARIFNCGFPILHGLRNYPLALRLASRFVPVLTYFSTYPQLTAEQQRELALLDTHDALTDGFKHSRTVEQIAGTLRNLGASDIEVWKGGNGVQARSRKL